MECMVGCLYIARVILQGERYVVYARSEADARLGHLSLAVRRDPGLLESTASTVGTGPSLLRESE